MYMYMKSINYDVPSVVGAFISRRSNKVPPPEVGGATAGAMSPPSKSNSDGSWVVGVGCNKNN